LAKLPGIAAEAASEGIVPTAQAEATAANGTEAAAKEKPKSRKSKAELGIPEDHTICWVPFAMDPTTDDLVTKVAAVRGVQKRELLIPVLQYGLEQYKTQFEADAQKYTAKAPASKSKAKPVEQMTDEELQKAAASAQKSIETAKARAAQLLEAAKARQAAAAQAAA